MSLCSHLSASIYYSVVKWVKTAPEKPTDGLFRFTRVWFGDSLFNNASIYLFTCLKLLKLHVRSQSIAPSQGTHTFTGDNEDVTASLLFRSTLWCVISGSSQFCNLPRYHKAINKSLHSQNIMLKEDGLLKSCCSMLNRNRCRHARLPTCCL